MDVRNKMDQKVLEMRGQTMTFSNDGMELSLNVPDTGDVKRVFGTMIDTVVDQQGEIVQLNTDLDKTVKENRVARQKIVSATTDKLQQLLAHQLKLEQQLIDAQKNIQNFAYNIQGYVDEHENESVPIEAVTRSHVKIAQNLSLDIGNDEVPDDSSVQTGPVTLFPTEDGASPTKLSVQHHPLSMFHPNRDSTSTKKKRSKSTAILETGINYSAIPQFTMPKNNVAAKWRWAIKKVLQGIRRKKLKIGFTRTRMEQKQTIAQRLDNVDRDLFIIPQQLTKEFDKKLSNVSQQLQQNIDGVKQDLTNYASVTDEHLAQTDAKVTDIAEKINSHDERITQMIDALAKKEEEDIRQVKETMAALRKQVHDEILLEIMRLTQTLQDLSKEFTELDHSAKTLMRDIKNTTVLSENPPEDRGVDLLTQLLDKDKSTRQQAHRMAIIEGHSDVLQRLLVETKEGIAAMVSLYLPKPEVIVDNFDDFDDIPGADVAESAKQKKLENEKKAANSLLSAEDIQQLQELSLKAQSSEGMTKSVKDSLSIMNGMLQRHDELLREVAQTVICESVQALDMLPALQTQLTTAVSNNSAVQESVKQLSQEKKQLQDQLSVLQHEQNNMSEKIQRTEQLLEGQDLRAVIGEMDRMRETMESFKGMIGGMQSQMMTIFQTVMIQAQVGNSKNGTKSLRNSVTSPVSPLRASLLNSQGLNAPPIPAEINTATVLVPAPQLTEEDSASNLPVEESASIVPMVDIPSADAEGVFTAGMEDGEDSAPDGNALQMMHQMMSMMVPSGNTSTTNMVSPSVLMQQLPVFDPNVMMMSNSNNMGMVMGGVTEQRVEEIVRDILDGMELSASVNPSPNNNKKTSRQASLVLSANDDSPSNKVKRQSSGLMGSFADYNARKSLSRMSSVKMSFSAGQVSNFDPSPLLADIANIRAEAMALQKQLDAMNEEKTTKADVEKTCLEIIRDYRKREARTDYRTMLEEMDVSMREIVHELIGVKKETERIEEELRHDFETSLNHAISETKKELSDAGKETVLSTKALCLGCGRSSMTKMESTSRPMSPSFLPALNANIQMGPDILRGGFKLPGRALSPPNSYPAEVSLLMKHRVQTAPAQAAEAAYNAKKSYFSQSSDPAFLHQQQVQHQIDNIAPSVHPLPINSSPTRPSAGGLRVGFADDEADMILPPIQQLDDGAGSNNSRHNKQAGRPGSSSFSSSLVEGGGSESNLTVTMPAIPLGQLNPRENIGENGNILDENEVLGFVPSSDMTGPASSNPNTTRVNQYEALPTRSGFGNANNNSLVSGSSIPLANISTSDSETLRPLYRRGFPAKKSFKAETTYAPDRFDLGIRSLGGSSLLSGSTTSLAAAGGYGVLNGNGSTQPRPSTVSSILHNSRHSNALDSNSNNKANALRATVSFAS